LTPTRTRHIPALALLLALAAPAAALAVAPDAARGDTANLAARLKRQAEAWDEALLCGRTRMTGSYAGEAFASHFRYVDTYVRQGDAWRVCSVQITPIRE
jgi:hypothetical protein